MSYCRWSSDNFQCDLYCYEDSSGYVTHVAASRHVNVPEVSLEDIVSSDPADIPALTKKWVEWGSRMDHEMAPIGLSYDGHSFHDPDLESFLERVTMLRDAGYRVPDYVFDAIKEEMKDDQSRTVD